VSWVAVSKKGKGGKKLLPKALGGFAFELPSQRGTKGDLHTFGGGLDASRIISFFK